MLGLNPLLASVVRKKGLHILVSAESPSSDALAIIFRTNNQNSSIVIGICIPWKGLTLFEYQLTVPEDTFGEGNQVSLVWSSTEKITVSSASLVWIIEVMFQSKIDERQPRVNVQQAIQLLGKLNLRDQFLFPHEILDFQPKILQEYTSPGQHVHYFPAPEDIFIITSDSSFMCINHEWRAILEVKIPIDAEHVLVRPWQSPQTVLTQPLGVLLDHPLSPTHQPHQTASVGALSSKASLSKVLWQSKYRRFLCLHKDGSLLIGHLDHSEFFEDMTGQGFYSEKLHLVLPVAYSLNKQGVSHVYEQCRDTGVPYTLHHLTMTEVDRELDLSTGIRSKIAKAKGFLTSTYHEEIARIVEMIKISETRTSVTVLVIVETRHLQHLQQQESEFGARSAIPVTYSLAVLQFATWEEPTEDAPSIGHHRHYRLSCHQLTTLLQTTSQNLIPPSHINLKLLPSHDEVLVMLGKELVSLRRLSDVSLVTGEVLFPMHHPLNALSHSHLIAPLSVHIVRGKLLFLHTYQTRDHTHYSNNADGSNNHSSNKSDASTNTKVSKSTLFSTVSVFDFPQAVTGYAQSRNLLFDEAEQILLSRDEAVHAEEGVLLDNQRFLGQVVNRDQFRRIPLPASMSHHYPASAWSAQALLGQWSDAQQFLQWSPDCNLAPSNPPRTGALPKYLALYLSPPPPQNIPQHPGSSSSTSLAAAAVSSLTGTTGSGAVTAVALHPSILWVYAPSTQRWRPISLALGRGGSRARLMRQLPCWTDVLQLIQAYPNSVFNTKEKMQQQHKRKPRLYRLKSESFSEHSGTGINALSPNAAGGHMASAGLEIGLATIPEEGGEVHEQHQQLLPLKSPTEEVSSASLLFSSASLPQVKSKEKLLRGRRRLAWMQKLRALLDESSAFTVEVKPESSLMRAPAVVLQMQWFGSHSLVLLTQRRSQMFVEVLSKEAIAAVMVPIEQQQQGLLAPELHRLLPLPPGFLPSHLDLVTLPTQHSGYTNDHSNTNTHSSGYGSGGLSQQTCVLTLRNDHDILGFQVSAYLTAPTVRSNGSSSSGNNQTKVKDYVMLDLFAVTLDDVVSHGSKVQQTSLYFPSAPMFGTFV